jgi:magnesium-transporting ATPase (P-type)
MSIANIFWGLILIAIGVLMLKFNFQLTRMFSNNNWFERNLGSGSTYIVMQMASVFIIFYAILLIFGLSDNFLSWLVSPLRSLFNR